MIDLPLTPEEAQAILAWLQQCERYRGFSVLRRLGPRVTGASGKDVADFIEQYPQIRVALGKLALIAEP